MNQGVKSVTKKKQDYHNSIVAKITPKEAFDKISRVSEWWASNLESSSRKLDDVFTVHFGDVYVTFKIVEVDSDKKVVWLVTDCNLSWLDDKKEWNGTKIVWEVLPQDGGTQVDMTHLGLAPGIECYDVCKIGWDSYIQKSLFKFLTESEGLPDKL